MSRQPNPKPVLPALAEPRTPPVAESPPAAAQSPLAELYREHAQRVARWVQRLGGPDCDVEDMVQEVFIAVHHQLPRFRGASRFTTWLYAITANTVRDRRRKQRLRGWLGGSALETAGHLPSPDRPADEGLEAHQRARRVYAVLDQMKEKFRSVLILHEMEGLSGEEIGELLHAKAATVWVWLHRARIDFARRMERLDAEEPR